MVDIKEDDEDSQDKHIQIEKISKKITHHAKFSMLELDGKGKRKRNKNESD